MRFNEKVKLLIKRWTGLTIYKNLPIGFDALDNIRRKMRHYKFRTFVDVGANVGQSAKYIRRHFPETNIYCIEPIKDTFHILEKNTQGLGLHCFNLALGSENQKIKIKIDAFNRESDRNSLLEKNNVHNSSNLRTETIQVLTLPQFCDLIGIQFIDYLKIDTEGYDLEVLKGAVEMLQSSSIAFIETEVSMNPNNTFHVDFVEVKRFLEKYNYRVFGIYEQIQERRMNVPMLRRANVLFISENLETDFEGK